ncbi:MAG: methylenetetrahydrofolate reductase [Roseovarius sp.]
MEAIRARAELGAEEGAFVDLMHDFSVETTPAGAAKIDDFGAILRPGTTVFITFLPGTDYLDTVATARRLRAEGFSPVPHVPARSMRDRAMLEDYLARVTGEAGVEHVLVIAGALERPLGPFADSMQLLQTGLFDRHGIRRIGVAGHPEGSPDMSDEAIAEALAWKRAFAEQSDAQFHIVTQFCFEAQPIIEWERRLRAEGNTMPIRVGLPGIAKLATLIRYAMACGIGNSLQFLKRKSRDVTRMMRQQAPDKLLRDLARHRAADPETAISGVHVYPLGGLRASAEWSYAVSDGRFTLSGKGFDLRTAAARS